MLAGKHSADAVAVTTFNFIKAVAVFLLMPYDWQWST
jgi:hypothetical protein